MRVPLIIRDPDASADSTRGLVSEALVEGIDIAPTLLDYFGGKQKPHIIEGLNLMPILRGETEKVRDWAISEYDFVTREAREILDLPADKAKLIMCADQRWKFVHSETFRPMLFDLENDPNELNDLGASEDPEHVQIKELMEARIFEWARQHHNRTTKSFEVLDSIIGKEGPGMIIAVYDEDDYEEAFGHSFEDRP